jgi:hypothetical protein
MPPARPSPSNDWVVRLLTDAARELDWRRAARTMWKRGDDHKIAIALRKSPYGDNYDVDVNIYLDRETRSLSGSAADVFFTARLVIDDHTDPAFDAFDFDRRGWAGTEKERWSDARQLIVDCIVPLVEPLATRGGLVDFIRRRGAARLLTENARRALGLALDESSTEPNRRETSDSDVEADVRMHRDRVMSAVAFVAMTRAEQDERLPDGAALDDVIADDLADAIGGLLTCESTIDVPMLTDRERAALFELANEIDQAHAADTLLVRRDAFAARARKLMDQLGWTDPARSLDEP